MLHVLITLQCHMYTCTYVLCIYMCMLQKYISDIRMHSMYSQCTCIYMFIYIDPILLMMYTYLEPIDSAAVDKRREHADSVSECISNGAHGQHHVQLLPHSVDKEVEESERCAISLL